MDECLIDLSIDEPIFIDKLLPASNAEYPSSVQAHSSLQHLSSLREYISASRKRDEEWYKVVEVSTAINSVSCVLYKTLTYTLLQDLLDENEMLKAENTSLKSQLTADGQSANATLWGKQNASPQLENLTQVEGLTQQLRDAQLSMVSIFNPWIVLPPAKSDALSREQHLLY